MNCTFAGSHTLQADLISLFQVFLISWINWGTSVLWPAAKEEGTYDMLHHFQLALSSGLLLGREKVALYPHVKSQILQILVGD